VEEAPASANQVIEASKGTVIPSASLMGTVKSLWICTFALRSAACRFAAADEAPQNKMIDKQEHVYASFVPLIFINPKYACQARLI
jgi:hypothetical protein